VTLTGGEPLLAANADELVKKLLARGCEVNIETNGSVHVADFRGRVKSKQAGYGKIFFTVDYKLPSSGVSDKMLDANYISLCGGDVLKFVIGSREDVAAMLQFVEHIEGNIVNAILTKKSAVPKMPQIYIGAVYGAFELPALADVITKNHTLKDARLQLQLHKVIWGPDKQGV
jgi:7-carboxy-7-deazaguanine synthase